MDEKTLNIAVKKYFLYATKKDFAAIAPRFMRLPRCKEFRLPPPQFKLPSVTWNRFQITTGVIWARFQITPSCSHYPSIELVTFSAQ